ncbi:MAG: hypothetical protein WDN06_04875 [Asticcacaulis sp.]
MKLTYSVSEASAVHVTFGVSAGTRPYISRSRPSTISGRRCCHHWSAVVTFPPFFRVRISGQSGYGLAPGLVGIGVVGRLFIAAGTRAQALDMQLVHHVLMILLGGEGDRRRRLGTQRRRGQQAPARRP